MLSDEGRLNNLEARVDNVSKSGMRVIIQVLGHVMSIVTSQVMSSSWVTTSGQIIIKVPSPVGMSGNNSCNKSDKQVLCMSCSKSGNLSGKHVRRQVR